MKLRDRTGERYGTLLVLRRGPSCASGASWVCLCGCGREVTITASNLKRGQERCSACYRPAPTEDVLRERRKANNRQQIENKRKWRKANAKYCAEYAKERARRDVDAYRASARAEYRRRKERCPERLRELSREICARRRSRFKGEKVAPADWLSRKEEFGHRCAYCLRAAALTQDHVIPLWLGGHHHIDNIVPACGSCNSSKRTRSLLECARLGIGVVRPC